MSKFLVIEKTKGSMPIVSPESAEAAQFFKTAQSGFEYLIDLQKKGKIVGGGPFLDIAGYCYVLEASSVEEMGETFFNSPMNMWVDREVHPLGTFSDTLEGMRDAMRG